MTQQRRTFCVRCTSVSSSSPNCCHNNLNLYYCDRHVGVDLVLHRDDVEKEDLVKFKEAQTHISSLAESKVFFASIVAGAGGEDLYLFCNTGGDASCSLWNRTHYVLAGTYWKPPTEKMLRQQCAYPINAAAKQLMIHTNFFSNEPAHWANDNLPMISFLLSLRNSTVRTGSGSLHLNFLSSYRVLVPDYKPVRRFMDYILRRFPKASRSSLIAYYSKGKKICLRGGEDGGGLVVTAVTTGENPSNQFNSAIPNLLALSRSFLSKVTQEEPCVQQHILYYSQPMSQHGVVVGNEDETVDAIREVLKANGRAEPLVVFQERSNMTAKETVEYFRCAKVIIGAYGGSLANLVLTSMSYRCADPVHVIEVSCGNAFVAMGCPYARSYFTMAPAPWVRHHLLFYDPSSTASNIYLPVDHLVFTLNDIFSNTTSSNITAADSHVHAGPDTVRTNGEFTVLHFSASYQQEDMINA